MSIEDHLTSTEDIVDTISCAHRVKYYVTNKRIIRHFHSTTREEMDDLLSSHVTSISLVSEARKKLIKIGLALLLVGVVAFAIMYILVTVQNYTPFMDRDIYNYICYGLAGLGLLLIIIGLIFRVAAYQFIAAGITEEIAARWKIVGVKAHDAREFIKAVRESIF